LWGRYFLPSSNPIDSVSVRGTQTAFLALCMALHKLLTLSRRCPGWRRRARRNDRARPYRCWLLLGGAKGLSSTQAVEYYERVQQRHRCCSRTQQLYKLHRWHSWHRVNRTLARRNLRRWRVVETLASECTQGYCSWKFAAGKGSSLMGSPSRQTGSPRQADKGARTPRRRARQSGQAAAAKLELQSRIRCKDYLTVRYSIDQPTESARQKVWKQGLAAPGLVQGSEYADLASLVDLSPHPRA
jgi:hypothetical protein